MISNQVLQNTIDGLKGITRIDLCVIDTEGKVLASTFPEADAYTGSVLAFIDSPADSRRPGRGTDCPLRQPQYGHHPAAV